MKAYTDIEQSIQLAKILPLESADMCYNDGELRIGYAPLAKERDDYFPCWSLAALLSCLPKFIDFGTYYTFLNIYPIQNLGWVVEYSNNDDIVDFDFNNKNLIDACYKMILKLHKQNLL